MENAKIIKQLQEAYSNAKTDGELRAAIYSIIMASINKTITDEDASKIFKESKLTEEAEKLLEPFGDEYITEENDPLKKER